MHLNIFPKSIVLILNVCLHVICADDKILSATELPTTLVHSLATINGKRNNLKIVVFTGFNQFPGDNNAGE